MIKNPIQNIINSDINISYINLVFSERKTEHWKHDRKAMAHHYISYQLEGDAYIKTSGNTYHTRSGEMLYIPKGADYHSRSNLLPFSFIMIEFDFYDDDYLNFKFENIYKFQDTEKIREIMLELLEAWKDKGAGNLLKLKMLMYKLFYAITKQSPELIESYDYKKIKKAIKYMEENYAEEYTEISQLAEMCEISTVQFNRIFKKLYNTTPGKYMNALRLEKAKKMLSGTDTPISLVSEYCGFSSTYYFSRLFKAEVGIPPLKYREKHFE